MFNSPDPKKICIQDSALNHSFLVYQRADSMTGWLSENYVSDIRFEILNVYSKLDVDLFIKFQDTVHFKVMYWTL